MWFDLQRYDGDVSDLGLTLSYDEDVMGQVNKNNIFLSSTLLVSVLCLLLAILILLSVHPYTHFYLSPNS